MIRKRDREGVSVNEELAEELHKPVTKKFKRIKASARYKDNIWAAYITEMESLSSKNKNVKHLKDKKSKTVLNAFIEIVNESNRKPNQLWVDQGRGFYNKLMQEWLDNNDILMYSTHNEVKSVIAERFIKTLKTKIYKKVATNDYISRSVQ